MAQEWNIRPASTACAGCATAFQDKAGFVSALKETEAGYERFDYCTVCWKTARPQWVPFSAWESEYTAPVRQVKEEPVKKENAEALLRRLIALEDPEMQNVVYVLAVMLERSKQLIERDARPHEQGILRVYEHKATGDTFIVFDPKLRLDQIGQVQQQVVALLSGTHHLAATIETGNAESIDATAVVETPSEQSDETIEDNKTE